MDLDSVVAPPQLPTIQEQLSILGPVVMKVGNVHEKNLPHFNGMEQQRSTPPVELVEIPFRTVPANAPPPKLFYRTWWRSLTRRAIRRQIDQ